MPKYYVAQSATLFLTRAHNTAWPARSFPKELAQIPLRGTLASLKRYIKKLNSILKRNNIKKERDVQKSGGKHIGDLEVIHEEIKRRGIDQETLEKFRQKVIFK